MKRLIPFVLLIVIVLAGIFSIPFLLRPESHRQEITDTLSKMLKRPVVIGPISMGYLPPTLRLEQVGVMKDDGNPILQIGTAAAPLDWGALFHLQIVPQSVELNHWVMTISRKPNGRWDIEDWLPGASGLSGAKAWSLQQVRWKEGEIHWVDAYSGASQELVLSSVEGHWDPRPETMDAKGTFTGLASGISLLWNAKGQFFSSPQWTGDLQLSDQGNVCTVRLEKQSGAFDGKGGAAKWRLASALAFLKFYGRGAAAAVDASSPLALDNWQVHVHGDDKHISFEHAAGISGGQSEAKGSVANATTGLLAHVEVALKNVPAQAVWSLTGENIPLSGNVTALTKNFELVLSTRTLSTLKGEGYWELTDGRYKLPDISVKKLARAKTMAYVRKKFSDFEAAGLPVTKLSAHWQAKAGTIGVDDGLIVSTDAKAAWVGKFDAARQGLDGYLRIQIHEKDPKLARLIPEKYRTQPANGRLQGTWKEWLLWSVPSSKIPAATQSKLRKAINQK